MVKSSAGGTTKLLLLRVLENTSRTTMQCSRAAPRVPAGSNAANITETLSLTSTGRRSSVCPSLLSTALSGGVSLALRRRGPQCAVTSPPVIPPRFVLPLHALLLSLLFTDRMTLHWIKTRLTAPAFREARSLTAALMCCIATRMVIVDQRTVRAVERCTE